jgi:hypothetical protein
MGVVIDFEEYRQRKIINEAFLGANEVYAEAHEGFDPMMDDGDQHLLTLIARELMNDQGADLAELHNYMFADGELPKCPRK